MKTKIFISSLVACGLLIVFLFVMMANYIDAHDDTFTVSEQYAAANEICKDHNGVDNWDTADDAGSGEGPTNVICRDGYATVVVDPNPDPDPGSANPYGPNEPWYKPF